MVRTRTKGKIIFVSSILGYFGLVGYSTYSPGKHAIRGETFSQASRLTLTTRRMY
jgi:3-dehydrosphinganine reductase